MKKQAILFALMIISLTALISAIPTPHAFSGKVFYSDDTLIQEALEIRAEINGNEFSSVLSNGVYDLIVESENPGTVSFVSFFIEGISSSIGTHAFLSFGITDLDFTTSLINPNPSGGDSGGSGGSSGGSSGGGGGSGGGSSRSNSKNKVSTIPEIQETGTKESSQEFISLIDTTKQQDKIQETTPITGGVIGFVKTGKGVALIFAGLIIIVGVAVMVVTRKK